MAKYHSLQLRFFDILHKDVPNKGVVDSSTSHDDQSEEAEFVKWNRSFFILIRLHCFRLLYDICHIFLLVFVHIIGDLLQILGGFKCELCFSDFFLYSFFNLSFPSLTAPISVLADLTLSS